MAVKQVNIKEAKELLELGKNTAISRDKPRGREVVDMEEIRKKHKEIVEKGLIPERVRAPSRGRESYAEVAGRGSR